jgi:phosphonatase-like hydrolase
MVVFDMAGTTVDEDNIVYKTLRRAIADHGYAYTLDQVLAEGAGKEKLQAIKSILSIDKNCDDGISTAIYDHFLILLNEEYAHLEVRPQPHAEETFHILKQNKILVVLNTGYDADTALSLIKKLRWEQGIAYDLLVTASDVKNGRPHPDMILHAMQNFGIHESGEVIKVGDSAIDIEEGKNARCALTIGVTTGAHTSHQLSLANPDFIISDLSELPKIINSYDSKYK